MRAVLREYSESGGARILLVGSDEEGTTGELTSKRRWPKAAVAHIARNALASLTTSCNEDAASE